MTVAAILAASALAAWLIPLLALMPGRRAAGRMRPFLGRRYAHRGLHAAGGGVPENSLPAFRLAADGGYGIELDLHLTADGELVVFHDDTLDRVCGTPGRVEDRRWAELRTLSLLGTSERMPLFRDLLTLVGGRVPLIVEVKYQRNYAALCGKMMDHLKDYPGLYCVESFYPCVLQWMKRRHPEVPRGFLSTRFRPEDSADGKVGPDMRIAEQLLCNFLTRPDFIAYHHEHAPGVWGFRQARRFWRIPAVAWTVRGEAQEAAARKWFDTVIFEGYRPEPFVRPDSRSG